MPTYLQKTTTTRNSTVCFCIFSRSAFFIFRILPYVLQYFSASRIPHLHVRDFPHSAIRIPHFTGARTNCIYATGALAVPDAGTLSTS